MRKNSMISTAAVLAVCCCGFVSAVVPPNDFKDGRPLVLKTVLASVLTAIGREPTLADNDEFKGVFTLTDPAITALDGKDDAHSHAYAIKVIVEEYNKGALSFGAVYGFLGLFEGNEYFSVDDKGKAGKAWDVVSGAIFNEISPQFKLIKPITLMSEFALKGVSTIVDIYQILSEIEVNTAKKDKLVADIKGGGKKKF
ncbi:hypothetical protein FACS189472_03740 [Alphaproteobacteria bacterium]|nr:hypothetical protein FACS189472_03740 [Alphaproteobacteria bacterium]